MRAASTLLPKLGFGCAMAAMLMQLAAGNVAMAWLSFLIAWLNYLALRFAPTGRGR